MGCVCGIGLAWLLRDGVVCGALGTRLSSSGEDGRTYGGRRRWRDLHGHSGFKHLGCALISRRSEIGISAQPIRSSSSAL